MLKAIAAAIAKLFKSGVGALRWTENLIFSPFRALWGGGALPRPEFAPGMTSAELLEEYEANRQAHANVHHVDRDGIDTVLKYATASATARETMDLSSVKTNARMTLLTMDHHELKALAGAGLGKIRKWIDGEDHGIFGVPRVTTLQRSVIHEIPPPPERTTAQQRMIWRVQSRLGKPDHSKAFQLA